MGSDSPVVRPAARRTVLPLALFCRRFVAAPFLRMLLWW